MRIDSIDILVSALNIEAYLFQIIYLFIQYYLFHLFINLLLFIYYLFSIVLFTRKRLASISWEL